MEKERVHVVEWKLEGKGGGKWREVEREGGLERIEEEEDERELERRRGKMIKI